MRDIFARLLAIGDADPTPRGAVLGAIVGVPIGVVAFWLYADEPPERTPLFYFTGAIVGAIMTTLAYWRAGD